MLIFSYYFKTSAVLTIKYILSNLLNFRINLSKVLHYLLDEGHCENLQFCQKFQLTSKQVSFQMNVLKKTYFLLYFAIIFGDNKVEQKVSLHLLLLFD